MWSPAISWVGDLTTFEIEDVILYSRERAIIADVKSGCCLLLLLLAIEIDLNLRSLDRSRVDWSLFDVFVLSTCIAIVAASGDNFA